MTVSPGRINRTGPARGALKGWKTSPRQRGIESTIGRVPLTPDGRLESEVPRRRKPKPRTRPVPARAKTSPKSMKGSRGSQGTTKGVRSPAARKLKLCRLCGKKKRNVHAHIVAVHKCPYCGNLMLTLEKHIGRIHPEKGKRA